MKCRCGEEVSDALHKDWHYVAIKTMAQFIDN